MLAGMPALAFAIQGALSRGWRAIQVWDEFLDRSAGRRRPGREARLEAAISFAAADELLVIGKSLTTRAAGVAARTRAAGGLADTAPERPRLGRDAARADGEGAADRRHRRSVWDGALARELSDDVVELARGRPRPGASRATSQAVVGRCRGVRLGRALRRAARDEVAAADEHGGEDGTDRGDPGSDEEDVVQAGDERRLGRPRSDAGAEGARARPSSRRSRRAPRSPSRSRAGGTCC